MAWLTLKFIKIYQLVWSPDHSWRKIYYPYGFCSFYPSCSQYAADAIEQKGFIHGAFLSVVRLFRCRPGRLGGYDPVKIK